MGDSRNPVVHLPNGARELTRLERKGEQLPVVGPWLSRSRRVLNILSVACAPSPEIWIKAAFYAFPRALWSAFGPTPLDFLGQRLARGKVSGGLKPRFDGTSPMGSGRRGKGTSVPKFRMDIWATDTLPQIEGKGTVAWLSLKGIQLFRRIGWYFTIADFLSSGTLLWVSTAYTWAGCPQPGAPYLQLIARPGPIIWGHTWVNFVAWSKAAGSIPWTPGPSISIPHSAATFIGWHMEATDPDIPNYSGASPKFRLFMLDAHGGHEVGDTTHYRTPDGHYHSSGVFTADDRFAGATALVQYFLEPGGLAIVTGGGLTWSGADPHAGIQPGFVKPVYPRGSGPVPPSLF